MTNIQAALLYDQLLHVGDVRRDKHTIFEEYMRQLEGHVVVPVIEPDTAPSEWMFVCGVKGRYVDVQSYMAANGVDIRPFFYDIGRHCHLQNIAHSPMSLDYTYFMLPSYPDLTGAQIQHVCDTLITYVKRIIDHI
jgi:dTDP-4-amino-4,6-dideoxygalactose transaminase